MNTKHDDLDTRPAFPHNRDACGWQLGMTMRDYFAAHAITACPLMHPQDKAAWCYQVADAMMEARK